MIRTPLPPGTLTTLWGNDDQFVASYLSQAPGFYLTGDGGYIDEDGYLFVMGRVDDVINVAGHRLSTGEMEEIIAGHPDVAECAVIGVADELKGQVPRGLVVLKAGVDPGPGAHQRRTGGPGPSATGGGGQPPADRRCRRPPEDEVGQDLAQDDARHGRRDDEPAPSTIEDASVLAALQPILRRS